MKILHINTNDLRGGAAKVMMRLLESQYKLGHNSKALVGKKESNHKFVYPFDVKSNLMIKEESKYNGYVDYDVQGAFNLYENPLVQEADVIHIHNLHGGYFNPFALSMLSHIKPVVWTLHDMQAVTGHCSHSFNCRKWISGCGNCPHMKVYPEIYYDRTKLNWIEKKNIYLNSKLYITPVGKWIGDIAKNSILKKHKIEVIYNGIDIETYRPMNKNLMKKKYGLPLDKIIIGTVSNGGSINKVEKGGGYVQEVINKLIENGFDILLLDVGGSQQGYINEYIYQVGYIKEEKVMAEILNTFDIFLFPSMAETFGLVLAEAMACGIPVVSFDSTGIPDVVKHGKSGFLALKEDVNQLYYYTKKLVTDADLRTKFSNASHLYSIEHFDHKLVTEKYLNTYNKAIKLFQERTEHILNFELNNIPDVIKKQKAFLNAEKIKNIGISEKVITRPTLSVIKNKIEENTDINSDIVFVKKSNYSIDNDYFETMLYKGISSDVLTSNLILKRKNKKSFYKSISPVNTNLNMIDTSIGSIFYSKSFFDKNRKAIISGELVKYNSIESFWVENISIPINEYIMLKVKEPVYIYGAGTHTRELLEESSYLFNLTISVIDSNPNLIGKRMLDEFEIVPIDIIKDNVPILISSASFEYEMYEELSKTVTNPLIKFYNQ
ncbi:glycosyltransferase [Niallia circulans]|uniref:glycosyltransferase n=1 Tax=Niallia circulans TaxID=1397 RepID=UPI002E1B5DF3|nr:glycosyltransferase [Niallia circulans]MED5098985.1 glycosyltransferase [Niallia circulans]